ncbi:hypothetical protein C3K47_09655 [Solitalea longa]|uniref:Peptidase C14 caspase domain-containing protein n=1 Tax=Solitalea longa TaxID=2079460 RepID=A0A2S5A2U5_9SPHI|nr:caspase family protein [Solitalea longa]POY36629.1 hypothetical protein C3K47_09655 [Solitalea longa]
MKIRLLIPILLLSLVPGVLIAQTQKALIIGIDKYNPPQGVVAENASRGSWTDLDGCVNDASSVKDLMIARYSFAPESITTLFNQEASRSRIIAEINKLIADPKLSKNDVVFIYYAGHGSQVYNSLSLETDKKDESMVPADSYKGAADIRDKELAAMFNKLLDKGVLLTIIFDSCHSGSAGRGYLNDPPKTRNLEESNADAKDASTPEKPESRGALMISAAQDFEFAKEQYDENNVPHGAFTIALLKALQQLTPDASVTNIYSSITAIMKYYGKTQEPVLAASEQRKAGSLFGLPKGTIKNKLAIGVSKIEAKGVELQGGYAFGLSEGVKLAAMSSKDTLEIMQMRGANKSLARVLTGSPSKIQPGSLFEVINWTSSKAPALKVYIPSVAIDDKTLTGYSKVYQSFRQSIKGKWKNDIVNTNLDRIYFYDNNKWVYSDAKNGKQEIGKSFSASALQASLGKSTAAFVNFPPTTTLQNQLQQQFKEFNNIKVVSDPNDSQYTLVGRLNENNQLEYALVKSQVTVQDTTESLPQRTDFVAYTDSPTSGEQVADKLSEFAFRIAKMRDWLMLTGPGGPNRFPFKLDFLYYTSGKPVTSDMVKVNDTLSVYLSLEDAGSWNYKKRYIYVFSIDSKGAMNLMFPDPSGGNVENRFPITNSDGNPQVQTHIADILITPPAGSDNYFLLSSEEAINNLSVFQQEGVLSRGEDIGSKTGRPPSALESILATGSKSRSVTITPVNWSITKKAFRTIE